jgi:uncharacterized protein YbbK (DUF523 family)
VPELLTEKVRVGISACVYRCPVRYNGRSFDALAMLGRERTDFVFTPVCPECMAGLGVPRMPIHLTGTGQEVLTGEARVRDRQGHDVTERVVAGSRACLESLERAGVEAMIAKEASPSCGLFKARVGKRRTEHKGGSGVFGAMLLETGWFLIPDEALANPLLWWDWRRRLQAWLWLKRRDLERSRDLYDAWHVLKFVVQEVDRPLADEIGRRLAALPKKPPAEDLEAIRTDILDALRRPSTRARIRQSMWKTYVHARKRGQLDGIELHDLSVDSPEVTANLMRIVEELTLLERVSFENDLVFGTSPVLRRDARRVRAREQSSESEHPESGQQQSENHESEEATS